MAFVIFFVLGARIDQHHIGVIVDLFFDPICGNGRVISGNFHVFRESGGENFDVGVSEIFRFGGRFMTELAFETAAIKNKQRVLIRRQLVGHLVKLAVRDADGHGDVPLVVLGPFGSGVDDHHIFRHRHLNLLHHKIDINDGVKHPVGRCVRLGGILSQARGGISENQCQAQHQGYNS